MGAWRPCLPRHSPSLRPFARQPQSSQFVEAKGTIPNMVKDGTNEGDGSLGQRCQCRQSGATAAFGIGVFLVYSATECGDQIVQFFRSSLRPTISSPRNSCCTCSELRPTASFAARLIRSSLRRKLFEFVCLARSGRPEPWGTECRVLGLPLASGRCGASCRRVSHSSCKLSAGFQSVSPCLYMAASRESISFVNRFLSDSDGTKSLSTLTGLLMEGVYTNYARHSLRTRRSKAGIRAPQVSAHIQR